MKRSRWRNAATISGPPAKTGSGTGRRSRSLPNSTGCPEAYTSTPTDSLKQQRWHGEIPKINYGVKKETFDRAFGEQAKLVDRGARQ